MATSLSSGRSPSRRAADLSRDLTAAQLQQYVEQHPDRKAAIYDQFTIVRWHNQELETVPYHIAYRTFLEPAAQAPSGSGRPQQRCGVCKIPAPARRCPAHRRLFPSDIAWLDLQNPKFDIIFAPYETYLDDLLGVKTSYGAAVLVRNEHESKKLEIFQKYVPDIQDALPLAAEDRPSKRGHADADGSDGLALSRRAICATAIRRWLTICRTIRASMKRKGSKKIFFKNFMDARVNYVISAAGAQNDGARTGGKRPRRRLLVATIMHEISHGLGPAFARTPTGKVDIREAIGPHIQRTGRGKSRRGRHVRPEVAGGPRCVPKSKARRILRVVRGGNFPHRPLRNRARRTAQAEMMEIQLSAGARRSYSRASGRYKIDYEQDAGRHGRSRQRVIRDRGHRRPQRAENWFKKYGQIPAGLKESLAAAANVPVDIDPVFAFPERVK